MLSHPGDCRATIYPTLRTKEIGNQGDSPTERENGRLQSPATTQVKDASYCAAFASGFAAGLVVGAATFGFQNAGSVFAQSPEM